MLQSKGDLKYYVEGKKPDTKAHILYNSIPMKCPHRQIYRQKLDKYLPRSGGDEELGVTAKG